MTIASHDAPSSLAAAPDAAEGHQLPNEDGWTRCIVPSAVTTHPDNCIMASRLRFRSSMKMTYDEYAARRDEREQLAHARALNDALAVLARHFDLTVEDVTRRLAAEE